ncbi:hypothetical protein [Paractinoplanes toevensis]|uniref:hypothetical protein n=1 Tax=Paractinoplanes toevensis TaxID=571911 RepID=UPI001BB39EDD|nr:hypothetical protein [Actinoplanes toevensis]
MSAATYLLYAVAALEIINAILTFATLGPVTDAISDVYADTTLSDSADTIITAFYAGGAVVNLLLGALFAVLGAFDSRGKNWARILTWVFGGIALCCVGAGLGSSSISGSLETSADTAGGPTPEEVQRRLDEALPSWFTPVGTTITVIVLIALLAVIILLALPKSNEFFRKQPAADQWGQPGQAYPPYPGQPPAYPPPAAPWGQPGQPAPGLPSYPGQQAPDQPPYPGQQPPPHQPPYPGQQPPDQPPYPGQPGPGQQSPPAPGQGTPPANPNPWGDQPPNPPTDRS